MAGFQKEVKFRAWDKGAQKMISWDKLMTEADFTWFADPDLVFMQTVAYGDDMGRDIYEGDIVDVKIADGQTMYDHKYRGLVRFNAEFQVFEIVAQKDGVTVTVYFRDDNYPSLTVVGNVFEHAKKLKWSEGSRLAFIG